MLVCQRVINFPIFLVDFPTKSSIFYGNVSPCLTMTCVFSLRFLGSQVSALALRSKHIIKTSMTMSSMTELLMAFEKKRWILENPLGIHWGSTQRSFWSPPATTTSSSPPQSIGNSWRRGRASCGGLVADGLFTHGLTVRWMVGISHGISKSDISFGV